MLYERPCTVDVANMLEHVYLISIYPKKIVTNFGMVCFATLGPQSIKACYVVVKEPKVIET